MANQVPLVIADFETQISGAISAGDTSFTLASATDDDGNALAAGKYCFTVNNGRSNKQYLMGQLNGTTVTSVVSVDRRGNETSGAAYSARSGSPVMISDFATIQRVADILRGQETLDGDNPIVYDAEPTLTDRKEVATVAYVLDNVAGGTVNFDNQIISSSDATAGETIAAGDWVFFQTSDQEWYKIDADTAAEVDGAYIGVALGAGSDGASITGGIQISGVYTTTGLTAGDIYYLSNTAGAISNSAGTTERAIGVALSTTKLLLNFNEKRLPTAEEKDFLTNLEQGNSSVQPQVVTFTSSGTWTKDTGLKYVVVEVQGAGGDGAASGGGGGGGAYSRKLVLASALGATETVTVGAAGVGSGTTSFGTHATAGNGADGSGTSGGAGGSAGTGDISFAGQTGGNGALAGLGGHGGSSYFGHGGAQVTSPSSVSGVNGVNGVGYGAGGGGGADAVDGDPEASSGGSGTAGIVIVTEYYS